MANDLVPPVPYKTAMLTSNGFLTPVWSAWFRQLWNRIGGSSSLSNADLEAAIIENESTSTISITALQADVATLQGNISDLNQGPVL